MSLGSFLRQNAQWLGAGALLTFLSSFGQTFFISVFAGEIRETFGLSHGQWGGIYTLGTGMAAVVMVWAGGLTDVLRVRQLGPFILAGLAMACLAMAFNPWAGLLFVVVFALRFFGQGMSSHIALVAMSRWFDATRGRALSVATMGFALGEALLPLTFVALMVWVDWHLLWIASAVAILLAVPLLMRLLRQERTPQSHAERSISVGMRGRHWTRKDVLTHPLFWFMVPAILGPPSFVTAYFFHQVHLADIKGWVHVELVRLFPVYTALSLGIAIGSGWALDRVGAVRLMPFMQVPMVAAFMIYAVSDTPGTMLMGLACMAITTGCMATLPNAFWAEVFGTAHIGAIKAMAAAVMVLGSAIGPGVTGLLIDLGLGIQRQFIGVSAYFVLATVMMMIGISRARKDL
ncbi:MFS transporter [Marinibacterium profundimaris]|uniref:MFS transporter n=1 Tax=Marinibacterium profundimaris TaxID=1679460 RepID=A0A225NVI4_9RHOB|nr:MFS transporter [Marinibacterium profundimaris]OWU75796.1 MFS transporter [Marinibacterium profundimaris]